MEVTYLIQKKISCIEVVLEVVGSNTQGLVLANVSENVAQQKADIAVRIEEEMRLLQEKHQRGFFGGFIFAQTGSRKWEAYYKDYEEKVVPLLYQYHQLTPSGAKTQKEIISDPQRRYQRGDMYVRRER